MTTPPAARRATTSGRISAPTHVDRNGPKVSVVIASRAEPEQLAAWLPNVAAECAAATAELIVVRAGEVAGLRSRLRYAGAAVVSAGAQADAESLRSIGLAAATGDIVLMLGDECEITSEWLSAMIARSAGRATATGFPRNGQ